MPLYSRQYQLVLDTPCFWIMKQSLHFVSTARLLFAITWQKARDRSKKLIKLQNTFHQNSSRLPGPAGGIGHAGIYTTWYFLFVFLEKIT